ncbi:MAG: GAF domain-containing protein, partial [bacterium]
MAQEANNANPKKLRFECGSHSSVTALVSYLAETIAHTLSCDQVLVTLLVDGEPHCGQFPPRGTQDADTDGSIFNISGNAASFNGRTWHLPLVINDLQRARVPSELALELAVRKVRSAGIFPLTVNGRLEGVVECFFTRSYHRWSQDEFDAFIALEKSQALTTLNTRQEKGEVSAFSEDDLRSQYRRMARYGNII